MDNERIAAALEGVARVLAGQPADSFRAHAYRRAARIVRRSRVPLAERYAKGGIDGLLGVPAVGPGIARTIVELLETGRLATFRGPGHARCEPRLASVPGIGPILARRVHQGLGVHTLEELATAAHDGRLARIAGFGARRLRGVSETLAGRLGPRPRPPEPPRPALPVDELLDVDREYREKAAGGVLLRIAPRHCNPEHAAWLPVLRTRRDGRQYTALFSNTARAHALGKTGDWVILYVDDGCGEREATVVTETQGPLAGRRVVRGREDDCAASYAAADPSASRAAG